MSMDEARTRLALVLGWSEAQLTDTQVRRFLAYEAERELEVRQDELRCAIEARPEPGGWWRRNFLDDPSWNRRQIEDWLQARLDYLPERLCKQPRM